MKDEKSMAIEAIEEWFKGQIGHLAIIHHTAKIDSDNNTEETTRGMELASATLNEMFAMINKRYGTKNAAP